MRGGGTDFYLAPEARLDNYFFYVRFQLIQKISTIIRVNKPQAHGRVFKGLAKVLRVKK